MRPIALGKAILFPALLAGILFVQITFADTTIPNPPGNQSVTYKTLSAAEFRFASALSVISQKCLGCHRGGGSATDFTALLASEGLWVSANLVVPGQSQNSLLYKYLQGSGFSPPPLGSMPLGGTLSTAERILIRDWIDRMLNPGPGPSPTPTATPGGTSYGLEPSQAVPRLGSRDYVKSVLDQVFGPLAASVTDPEVFFRISIFGGVCDQMGQLPATGEGEDQCSGVDASKFSAPIIAPASPSRAGRNIQACNRLVFNSNDQIARYAITQATQLSDLSYLNSNPIPTAAQIVAAYTMFNPGEPAPPQAAIDSLNLLAQVVQEPAKPLDPWRYVLLLLCYYPQWQVK